MVEQEGKKEEEKFEFDSAAEALGYISLEQARLVAMQAARENPGNYGRPLAGTRMVFQLVEEGEDYYIVTLSFRPEGDFAGSPGQEQFFIEKEGAVADRQVLSLPAGGRRRHFPVIPVVIGAGVLAVVVVAGVVFAAGGLGSGGDAEGPVEALVPTNTPAAIAAPVPPVVAAPTDTPKPTPAPTGAPVSLAVATPPLAAVAVPTTVPPVSATAPPLPNATTVPAAAPRAVPTVTPIQPGGSPGESGPSMGYSLEVIKEGSGTVNVHVGAGVAIFECAEPQCLFGNLQATSIVLGVMPKPPWVFRGWLVPDQPGACPGTGNCAISKDRDVTVIATFEPGTGSGGQLGGSPGESGSPMGYSLEVVKEGSGTVNVHVGAGVAIFECAEPQCLFGNLQATSIVLGIIPKPPWVFRGWLVPDQPGPAPAREIAPSPWTGT